jgi:hypothetical protein
MSTDVDNDTRTLTVTGLTICHVYGCTRDAAIIADTHTRDRFCLNHALEAASVPSLYPEFSGWYRITAVNVHHHGILLTVHPL